MSFNRSIAPSDLLAALKLRELLSRYPDSRPDSSDEVGRPEGRELPLHPSHSYEFKLLSLPMALLLLNLALALECISIIRCAEAFDGLGTYFRDF